MDIMEATECNINFEQLKGRTYTINPIEYSDIDESGRWIVRGNANWGKKEIHITLTGKKQSKEGMFVKSLNDLGIFFKQNRRELEGYGITFEEKEIKFKDRSTGEEKSYKVPIAVEIVNYPPQI